MCYLEVKIKANFFQENILVWFMREKLDDLVFLLLLLNSS